jgi:hypothetical protein
VRDPDRIIERIMSRAGIPGAARRRDIERELRDHLEDMADDDLEQFGSPEAVGDALARVYATERLAAQIARALALVIVSGLAAAAVIGSVQAATAIGTAPSVVATLVRVRSEFVGLVAVAFGYCASYGARRRLRFSLPSTVALIIAAALWLRVGLSVLAPQHAGIATVAFLSTALGGALSCTPVPLLWLAGTAAPLLIAGIAFGPLLPDGGRFSWTMWLGLSLSCVAMRFVVRTFERHVFQRQSP